MDEQKDQNSSKMKETAATPAPESLTKGSEREYTKERHSGGYDRSRNYSRPHRNDSGSEGRFSDDDFDDSGDDDGSREDDDGGYMPKKHAKQFKKYKKKVCRFCTNKLMDINYKNIDILERFVTDRGKILPRRITGTCAKHQRTLARAIKVSRSVALLPFTVQ